MGIFSFLFGHKPDGYYKCPNCRGSGLEPDTVTRSCPGPYGEDISSPSTGNDGHCYTCNGERKVYYVDGKTPSQRSKPEKELEYY